MTSLSIISTFTAFENFFILISYWGYSVDEKVLVHYNDKYYSQLAVVYIMQGI